MPSSQKPSSSPAQDPALELAHVKKRVAKAARKEIEAGQVDKEGQSDSSNDLLSSRPMSCNMDIRRPAPLEDLSATFDVNQLLPSKRQRTKSCPCLFSISPQQQPVSEESSDEEDWLAEMELGNLQRHLRDQDDFFVHVLASMQMVLPENLQQQVIDRAKIEWAEIDQQENMGNSTSLPAFKEANPEDPISRADNKKEDLTTQIQNLAADFMTPQPLMDVIDEKREWLRRRPQE